MRTAAFIAALLALAGIAVSAPALAHRTSVSVGVGFGFGYPFWGPWGYPAPYYYYPVPVAVPAQPVTYIEQRASAPASDRGAWWYYCDAAKGYYPYVRECPTGWQRVSPVPTK
jgi:hypothetical protein